MEKQSNLPNRVSRVPLWPPWQEKNLSSIAMGMTVIAGLALFTMMVMMTIHVVGRKLGQPVLFLSAGPRPEGAWSHKPSV